MALLETLSNSWDDPSTNIISQWQEMVRATDPRRQAEERNVADLEVRRQYGSLAADIESSSPIIWSNNNIG